MLSNVILISQPRPSRGSANFSRSKRPISTRNGNTKNAWESGTESPGESVHDSMNMPGNINVFPAQQRGIPNYYDGQPEGIHLTLLNHNILLYLLYNVSLWL